MAKVAANIARMAARAPEAQAGIKAIARARMQAARGLASTHKDSGAYARSFRVRRGRIDWYIESTDPAAVSKEFGRTGGAGTPGHGRSRGVYALTRAIAGEG